MTRLMDYSFSRPLPTRIKALGYSGVLRYLSGDSAKALTAYEVTYLHSADLVIGLVWENSPTHALDGHDAGVNDRIAAETAAKALGYPTDCPIFYAVDTDTTWARVSAYFGGVSEAHSYRWGVYGSYQVVKGAHAAHPNSVNWQTIAWSGGKKATDSAVLYQDQIENGYDGNLVWHPVSLWGPQGAVTVGRVDKTPTPLARSTSRALSRTERALGKIDRHLTARVASDAHPITADAQARFAAATATHAKVDELVRKARTI